MEKYLFHMLYICGHFDVRQLGRRAPGRPGLQRAHDLPMERGSVKAADESAAEPSA